MSGVGLSQVNFDVQGLEDDEEQQLEKEDQERERELHELLSNELPDELLDDDDNISFSSQGLGSSTHGHRTPEFNLDQSFEHHDGEDVQGTVGQGGTATYYHHERPLLTRRGEEFIRSSGFSGNGTNHESVPEVDPDSVPRGYGFSAGGGGGTYGYGRELAEQNGDEVDHGGEYLDQGNDVHDNHGYLGSYQSDGTNHVITGPVGRDGGDSDNWRLSHQDGDQLVEYDNGYPTMHPTDGTTADFVVPPGAAEGHSVYPMSHDLNFNEVYPSHGRAGHHLQQEAYDVNDTFKVQYTRNKSVDVSDSQKEIKEGEKTDRQSSIEPPSSELAQLQVLHRARGRKLEELSTELALKEKGYERQIRILDHQLSLVKGDRDGMASSLKHAQEVATDTKQDVDELQRRLHDFEMEKERSNTEKNETESELEAAKTTIESLHQQLMELEKSESLSRAREQHENVVMATRKRFEEEVVRLKQKLDDVNNTLLWKNEESKRLNDELTQARKETDRVRLDRAETVNRLTKSLEQSQRQNEELLRAGSTQEISHLQSQLQRTLREREDLEEHYRTMETDLVDLKEQLRTYESVSRLGLSVKNETMTPLPATDYVKRNLAAEEWKTPALGSNQRDFSTEEAMTGLQKELQHCLARNRSKREEIEQLRSQIDVVKKDAANKEMERGRIEMVVKKQEIRVLEQEKKIADLEEMTKNPEKRDEYRESELTKMKAAIEEYAAKLQQCVKREEELEQLNLQLKSQMSEMVREYDADKQKSIEQCRQSCLQFHDEAMKIMKEELQQEHEEQMKTLRLDLERISSELDQAKESYVVLSEETRWIEKQTRERCDEETRQKIEELRAKWDQDKSCEIVELRQNIVTEMERNFGKEKLSWQKDEEGLTRSKIDAEIALAKMDWAREQEKLRKDTIEYALREGEKEWLEKFTKSEAQEGRKREMSNMKYEWEREKEKEFEQRMDELRKELRGEMEQEHDGKLSVAREEWDRMKVTEIEREIEKAKRNWDEDTKKLIAEAKETVSLAKSDWFREQAEIRQNAIAQKIEEIKAEALAAAKKDLEKISDMRIENILQSEKAKWRASADEEKQRALETAVLLAEEQWRTEHQGKVSEAVKEALEVAQNSWKKERENAIESAVTQSLDTAKATWNKSKVEEIEQILSAARKQWFKEFGIFKRESSTGTMTSNSRKSLDDGSTEQTNKAFNYLEAQYTKNLNDFRENELKRVLEEYEQQKCIALEELESKYEMKLKKLREGQQKTMKNDAENSRQDREAELKELETAYQAKLQGIIDEIEEKYSQEREAMENDWIEKYERGRCELEEAYRAKFEKERERLGRDLQQKYESGIEKARKKLEYQLKERLQSAVESAKHEWEEEQEEDRVALEEQHVMKLEADQKRLRKEMEEQAEVKLSLAKNDAIIAAGQFEEKLQNEKERHAQDIEKLQCELQDIKQRLDKHNVHEAAIDPVRQTRNVEKNSEASQTDVVRHERWTSLAEITDDVTNSSRLHDLRRQYLATASQLKEDFMQHAVETKKNAAKSIRSEVMKERHATGKRLRKYYLECLKQILDDDKEAVKNDQNPRSNQEKMKVMEDSLRLPDEKDESIMSSTLTNVTALPDGTVELHPITLQNGASYVTFEAANTSPSGKPRELHQDHRLAQNAASRGTTLLSRSPTNATAKGYKPEETPRTGRREPASGEWVNYSRGHNYHEAIDHGVKPPVLRGGQDFSKGAYGSNLPGLLVSSMDSLLSIDDGRQVDLPPAINFSQQQIPDRLLQPEGESETSSSTGLSDSSKEESTRREKSRERDTKSSRGRHERVRRCENSERTHKVTKTRTSKDAAQPPVGRTTPVQLSHPVIAIRTRNEQPNKLTSSLLRPIRDVLPSKPLSPVARAPVKFSYTMHSGSRKSK